MGLPGTGCQRGPLDRPMRLPMRVPMAPSPCAVARSMAAKLQLPLWWWWWWWCQWCQWWWWCTASGASGGWRSVVCRKKANWTTTWRTHGCCGWFNPDEYLATNYTFNLCCIVVKCVRCGCWFMLGMCVDRVSATYEFIKLSWLSWLFCCTTSDHKSKWYSVF